MRWIEYTLEPINAVSAGSSGEVHFDRAIHEVLPGSVLRGALAAAWWLEEHGDQAAFDELFEYRLRVQPGIPVLAGQGARLDPMTWSKTKYSSEPADRQLADEFSPDELADGRLASPGRVTGRGWAVPREWLQATTRTALERGVAKDGQLFTRRASRKGVCFVGHLALTEESAELGWLLRKRKLSVGGQLSVLGRCRWSAREVADPYPAPQPGGRVELVALQPIILLNNYGANSLDLGGAVQAAVAAAGGTASIVQVASRPVRVGGWHGRAGFQKPVEWALDAGSAVVLDNPDKMALTALHAGLGIRRAEGYGTVVLLPHGQRFQVAAGEIVPSSSGEEKPAAIKEPESEAPDEQLTRPATPATEKTAAVEPASTELALLGEKVAAVLASFPANKRKTAVNNMFELARALQAMKGPRKVGIPKRKEEEREKPWAKELPEVLWQRVLELYKRSDYADLITELEALR